MLGSIERSLHKVRHALTPKKPSDTSPVVLAAKDLCNVSTTQCNDPEFVISELLKALHEKGIMCERKGFRLRGKMEPSLENYFGGCSFELEICYVPTLIPSLKFGNDFCTPTKSILKNGLFKYDENHPTTTNNNINNNNIGSGDGGSKIPKTPNGNVNMYSNAGNFNEPFGSPMSSKSYRIGIRRKRLKGDSWCYKKVCEEILALTAADLKQSVLESLV
ncbi:uncharacterized protein LOC108743982 [Agrilus planipennis]|nr:uncharacterized protein LOC108743982 [Agrilus planipennis]